MKNIRIDDVVIARSDYAAAEPLPDGLPNQTYNAPIIVRDDMVLVDGLRRLLWHREQGHDTIRANVVTTFLEAVEALAPLHEGRRITAIRTWNFVSLLNDYANAWSRQTATGGWARDEKGNFVRSNSSEGRRGRKREQTSTRLQYRRALNIPQHHLQSSIFMYRLADRGDARAQELVKRVEAGEFGIVRANRHYKEPNNLTGTITNRAEQARILERVVMELHAQVTSLQKLGHPLVVPSEELATALEGIASARTELTKFVSGFRSILKERESNGQ